MLKVGRWALNVGPLNVGMLNVEGWALNVLMSVCSLPCAYETS
jgi:hypothetical protein